jgi:hypothetical protein
MAYQDRVWFPGFLRPLGCAMAAVVASALVSTMVRAGDDELTVPRRGLQIDGTVERNEPEDAPLPARMYLVKMSAKKTYRIDMTAQDQKQLDAFLIVQDLEGNVLAVDDNSGGGRNARLSFSPPRDGTYKVFAAAVQGAGKYTLRLTEEQPLQAMTVPREGLKSAGTVRLNDPKTYLVKMSAKKQYRMEMTAHDQKQLDAFLFVQDLQGNVLAGDDNYGVGPKARLVFSPPKDGTYQIMAAAVKGECQYTLSVTEEDPGPGIPPPRPFQPVPQFPHDFNQPPTPKSDQGRVLAVTLALAIASAVVVYLGFCWLVARQAQRRGYALVLWFLASVVSANPLLVLIVLAMLPDARRLRLRQAEHEALEKKLLGVQQRQQTGIVVAPERQLSVGDRDTVLPEVRSLGDEETRA